MQLGSGRELQSPEALTKDRYSFPELIMVCYGFMPFMFSLFCHEKMVLYGKHVYVYVAIKQTGFAV